MQCPKCGLNLPDDAKFCTGCGADVYADAFQSDNLEQWNTRDIPETGSIHYSGVDYQYDSLQKHNKKMQIIIISAIAVIVVLGVVVLMLALGGNAPKVVAGNSSSSSVKETVESDVNAKTVLVPAVSGYDYNSAVKKLSDCNLSVTTTAEYNSSVPENAVVRQTPASGAKAFEGDVVTLVLSKGPDVSPNYSAYDLPSYVKNDSSYIIPDSSIRYISYADVEGLSKKSLEVARNEIYARHGRRFKNTDLQEYFNSKTWYVGTIAPDDFSESLLSTIEKTNIQTLLSYEDHYGSNYTPETSSSSPVFRSISASSVLPNEGNYTYYAENVCYDNDKCWTENASGVGKGEWIKYSDSATQTVSGVSIKNGYLSSLDTYKKNGKVTRMRFEFSDGTSYTATLDYNTNPTTLSQVNYFQNIDFGRKVKTTYIKMIIEDAVSGTNYSDTCITTICPY